MLLTVRVVARDAFHPVELTTFEEVVDTYPGDERYVSTGWLGLLRLGSGLGVVLFVSYRHYVNHFSNKWDLVAGKLLYPHSLHSSLSLPKTFDTTSSTTKPVNTVQQYADYTTRRASTNLLQVVHCCTC